MNPAKADRGDDADEEEASSARNVIPVNLSTGVSLRPVSESSVSEGRTKPPKPFTEATLLAAMEHASRYVEDKDLKAALDDDESHSGGIGTPATRADVIEKLVHAGYMERKGKQLHSTEAGRTLVDVVSPRLRDVSLTADMERSLGDVEHGKADADAVYEEFRGYARAIPADAAANVKAERVGQSGGKTESYGRCPRCGGNVVKRGKTWTCSTNRNEKQADDRHMETNRWMRVPGLPDDRGQDPHRCAGAEGPRRSGRPRQRIHIEEREKVRRPAGRRQGTRRRVRFRQIPETCRRRAPFVHPKHDWLEHVDGNGAHAIPAGMSKDASSKKRKRRLPKVIRDEQSKGGRVRP